MYLLIYSLFSSVLLHARVSLSFVTALRWPIDNPSQFFVQWVFIYTFMQFARLIVPKLKWLGPHFIFAAIAVFGSVSAAKFVILAKPISYWDIQMAGEGLEMLANLEVWKLFAVFVLLSAFILSICFVFQKLEKTLTFKFTLNKFVRIPVQTISIVVLVLMTFAKNPVHDKVLWALSNFQGNTPFKSLKENGFFLTMLHTKEIGYNPAPENFSEEQAHALLEKMESGTFFDIPSVMPDIVVIMSESLFDPYILPSIVWKSDPMPFTRGLAGKNMHAAKVTGFSTGTGSSEFEFLTGFSSIFNNHSTPYKSAIYINQLSLPRTLKKAGYRTIAMHPNDGTVYNRANVYPLFDFDEFIDLPKFKDPKNFGFYTSDETLYKELQNSLDKHKDQPSFHFLVTIQNHWPYTSAPMPTEPLMFDPKGLNSEEVTVLNAYTKLAQNSDQALKKVVEYLFSRNRPTLLIVFGDHLPALNESKSLFTKTGLVKSMNFKELSDEEFWKMHSTPLIIKSNFDFKFSPQEISLNYLGISILNELGFPLNSFQRYALEASKVSMVMPRKIYLDKDMPQIYQDYKMVQYYSLLKGISIFEDDFKTVEVPLQNPRQPSL